MNQNEKSSKKYSTIHAESFFTAGDLFRKLVYIPELKEELDSIQAALLFSQMEYWFLSMTMKTGKAEFYKKLSDKEDPDSWINEIGFNDREYRYAFDKIGVRHNSKSLYLEGIKNGSVFFNKDGHEMYFASFVDRNTNYIHYRRNKKKIIELQDRILDKQTSLQNSQLTESEPQSLQNLKLSDDNFCSSSLQNSQLINRDYTENTTKITTENNNLINPDRINDSNEFDQLESKKKKKRRTTLKLEQEEILLDDPNESIYPKGLIPKTKPNDLDQKEFEIYSESLRTLYDMHVQEMEEQGKSPNKRYMVNTNDPIVKNERFILKELVHRLGESLPNLIKIHAHKVKTDTWYAKEVSPSKIQNMYDKGKLSESESVETKTNELSEHEKLVALSKKEPLVELFHNNVQTFIRGYLNNGPAYFYDKVQSAYKDNYPDKYMYSLKWFWKEKPRIDAMAKITKVGQNWIDKHGVRIDEWSQEKYEAHVQAERSPYIVAAKNDTDTRWEFYVGIDSASQKISIEETERRTKEIMDARRKVKAGEKL